MDEEPSATVNVSYVGTRLMIGSLRNELNGFVDGHVHGFHPQLEDGCEVNFECFVAQCSLIDGFDAL